MRCIIWTTVHFLKSNSSTGTASAMLSRNVTKRRCSSWLFDTSEYNSLVDKVSRSNLNHIIRITCITLLATIAKCNLNLNLLGVLYIEQAKLLDRNQILGRIADQNSR